MTYPRIAAAPLMGSTPQELRMVRSFVFATSLLLVSPLSHASPRPNFPGTVTNPVFSFRFGSAPGLDRLDYSGGYTLGTGAPALAPATDVVTLSFDNGRFSQTLPSGSFTCTTNGQTCSYTNAGGSGITNFVIKPLAKTFTIAVRNADFTGTNPAQMGALSFVVGSSSFTITPNSPPVGKITGPASATIGSLLTFDASSSTDFNADPLSFSWSLVSQPLGSSASLSSTTNPTTSLTVTTNGAYVLKVVPNDGIVAGVPALITVNATGGATPPPPAPGPDNGLSVLSSDSNTYIAGQSATVSLHVNVPVGNGARRYFFAATYDDQPVALTTVTNQVDYTFVTPAFTASGTHVFKVVQYVEITDIANDLVAAINNYNKDITAVNKALQFETDPAVISQLQAQIAQDQAQIAIDQQKQVENRTQVAAPALLNIVVQ
jgi:hypothetical protein